MIYDEMSHEEKHLCVTFSPTGLVSICTLYGPVSELLRVIEHAKKENPDWDYYLVEETGFTPSLFDSVARFDDDNDVQ